MTVIMAGVCDDQAGRSDFSTTEWSVVLEARQSDPACSRRALERLCTRYWLPLYAFVRRRGHSPQDAEDLTQSFFEHLLKNDALVRVDRSKGLFRTFLLTSLVNFLNDKRDRQKALKRGGHSQIIPLDSIAGEEFYRSNHADAFTPEKLFERHWAFTVIEQVLARLRREYEADGKSRLCRLLEPSLTGEIAPGFYAHCAVELSMSEGAVRVALHRMRRRLGKLLRSEIARTVTRPEEVDDEIRQLFAALGK